MRQAIINLQILVALLVALAFPAAAAPTQEVLTFVTDGMTSLPIPSTGNYTDYKYLANIGSSKTFTVPTWASKNESGKNGVLALSMLSVGSGTATPHILVCAQSAFGSKCGSAQTDFTADITDGSAPDPDQLQMFLEPIAGSRITSVTVTAMNVSATGVWGKFYRSR